MRSTIDVRQFTGCEYVFAFASSIASTSTTGIVAAGAELGVAAGAGVGAVEELPDTIPADGGPAGDVGASWWPNMLAFSLSKMPMGCLAVSVLQGAAAQRQQRSAESAVRA